MIARLLIGLGTLLLAGSPLAAQSAKSGLAPPPVFTVPLVPPEPPRIRAPYLPPELLENYRQYCGEGRESVRLPDVKGARATFVARDSQPDILALCIDSLGAARVLEADAPIRALMMLAYRPLEPFWPSMEREWGANLGELRAELALRARGLDYSVWGMQTAGFVNRAVARAGALRNLGFFDEALAEIDAADQSLREMAGEERRADLDFERTLLASYRAGTTSMSQGDEAAAAVMGRFLGGFPRSSAHYLNPLVNYAAYLAEAGENARSRALIEPAYEEFRGQGYDPLTYHVGGSDREFAWIIACNRWRLEGAASAQPFIEIVAFADEHPADEYFAFVKPSTAIKRRMYRCIGNASNYFRQFADGALPQIDPAWLYLQPQWGDDDGPLPSWTFPDEVAARFARYYRVLPERYAPAMRRWGADRSGR